MNLGSSPATVPAAAEEPRTPQVEWDQCPDDVVAQAAPTKLQCATVPVPLDHADPAGEQIDLTVSRRGVLMLNPGGPGGSGPALSALLVAQGLPGSVTGRYDLIPAEPPVKIDAEGPGNVLLLRNRRDASAPHRGGKMLREKFGDRARLVSVDDSGHGVYVRGLTFSGRQRGSPVSDRSAWRRRITSTWAGL
ncbi:alpha/beta hydrolase [Streptomyces kanamyceticus]|uniref:alpha/beta hydrolase n=1 Tax=Streptomyces kanamyceticus TaxID=1967 RepID=UPI0037DC160C